MNELDKLIEQLEDRKGVWPTLAMKAGISQTTIWRIINRKTSPSWDTMQALTAACKEVKGPRHE
jgi:transcriptional regulator with XRE-family HTH domain